MINKIKTSVKEYFPLEEGYMDLGVSEDYLDLVIGGVIFPSASLILKAKKEYGFLGDTNNDSLSFSKNQSLLFTSEALSYNKEFINDLSMFDKVSEEDLSCLVSKYYPLLEVKEEVPGLLMGISNFFNKNKEEIELSKGKNDEVTFFVSEDYVPENIESVSLNLGLWERKMRGETKKRDDFNKMLINYKAPFNKETIDIIRREIEGINSNSFNSNLYFISSEIDFRNTRLDFKEKFPLINSKECENILTLENDRTVGVYFHTLKKIIGYENTEGGVNKSYFPSPSTLKLINRVHNYKSLNNN